MSLHAYGGSPCQRTNPHPVPHWLTDMRQRSLSPNWPCLWQCAAGRATTAGVHRSEHDEGDSDCLKACLCQGSNAINQLGGGLHLFQCIRLLSSLSVSVARSLWLKCMRPGSCPRLPVQGHHFMMHQCYHIFVLSCRSVRVVGTLVRHV